MRQRGSQTPITQNQLSRPVLGASVVMVGPKSRPNFAAAQYSVHDLQQQNTRVRVSIAKDPVCKKITAPQQGCHLTPIAKYFV